LESWEHRNAPKKSLPKLGAVVDSRKLPDEMATGKKMLNAHFRPLDQWPGKRTQDRKGAQFKATYMRTLDLLEYELDKLGAKQIVIQIEDPLAIKGIRNDGSFSRGAANGYHTPGKPGVILSFESPKGAISMPCDRYDDWADNLRAIALALEALRAVDRYGVTRGNEQYRGWAKLEAPGAKNGKMDRDAAFRFLAGLHKSPPENMARLGKDQIRDICRTARIENHPDRGGSHETFVTIAEAERILTS
jgi:hypothetical protein